MLVCVRDEPRLREPFPVELAKGALVWPAEPVGLVDPALVELGKAVPLWLPVLAGLLKLVGVE